MKRLVLPLLMLTALAGAQEQTLPDVNELTMQHSENGLFSLHAEPHLQPVRLNTMHRWTLRVADADDKAVAGATIAVDGGMPGHGHGLPTAPQVTAGDTPGEYVMHGLRFNMSGVWELRLKIDDGERSDGLHMLFVVADTPGQ